MGISSGLFNVSSSLTTKDVAAGIESFKEGWLQGEECIEKESIGKCGRK